MQVWEPATNVCQECVDAGDTWPNLRMCLVCGHVGCCDTSKNKHMKQHVDATGHPLIRSIEPGEAWVWCYVDEAFISAKSPQLQKPTANLNDN
ncbi:MAG: UBP-type zinc finger domain-containing protein [Anaerolineae bacterium]|nr:UBP-type zinc finger domain-containing protein [Anaerolineae bacterium]